MSALVLRGPLDKWEIPSPPGQPDLPPAALLVAAVIVLIPGSPLGLLTEGVQTLAGVLLPSATVFLLLLCNDRDVLGPWVNSRRLNLFTSIVVGILVRLSIVLTRRCPVPINQRRHDHRDPAGQAMCRRADTPALASEM